MTKKTINFEDFLKIDMRVGTILEVSLNQKARKPAYVLKIDFGLEIGIKQSSAQITNYSEEELINKKIIAVCNFEKKNIAGIESEVLILGSINKMNEVLLISASSNAKNGDHVA
jgi:tRNA-binding protein